nr:glycerol dehydrogenase [Melioribacteraceae bacterium]
MNDKLNSEMKQSNRILKAVFPGKYLQGSGLLKELPELVNIFGISGMILTSKTVNNNILSHPNNNGLFESLIITEFNGECSNKEITRVKKSVEENNIDVLIGMGGGKVIDTAKIVADKVDIPVIVFPTIASTDAPCSGVAVIYTDDGVFESVYYLKLNPQIVAIDMDIIKLAPVRFLIAGIGDALATRFEAEACYRAKSKNECGGYGTLTALNLAQLCYSTILNYGEPAILANKNNVVTYALNHVVEANTLLSGIGFESAGLAAAHSI